MRTVTAIALAAFGVCACKDPPAGPPGPVSRQGIELVSRGAIPHQKLRYQLTRGVKTPIELESDAEVSMGSIQRVMPTSVLRMEISADDVLPDGNTRMRTRIVSATGRERANATVSVETVNAQAMMLGGLEITGTLTPRGRVQDTRLAGGGKALPAKAVQQIEQMLKATEEVAMPLPEPGVGVGAIWRVRKDLLLLGVKLETITLVELTAIDGPRVAFLLRTEVTGADQTADIDGLKAEVMHIRGGGTGKGTIDLGRMAMTGEQEVELSFDVSAMDHRTTAKMRLVQRSKSGAGAPNTGAPNAGSQNAGQGAQSAP